MITDYVRNGVLSGVQKHEQAVGFSTVNFLYATAAGSPCWPMLHEKSGRGIKGISTACGDVVMFCLSCTELHGLHLKGKLTREIEMARVDDWWLISSAEANDLGRSQGNFDDIA